MRSRPFIRYLKFVFLLLTVAVVPGLQQSLVGAGSTPALIQDLSFKNTGTRTIFTVSADRLIDYTSYYPNPRLFILDIPEAQSSLPRNFVSVKTSLVDFATVSQIGEGEKSLIRIEFNLSRPVQYALQGEGSKIRLVFDSAATAAESRSLASQGDTVTPVVEPPQPTSIRDVTIEESEDQIEFQLLTSTKPSFRYFELQKPQRLVIDVENSTFKVARKAVTVNSDLIERLRFGNGESSQGRLVRCVFDLSHRAPYQVIGTESGLLVRFHKAEKPSVLNAQAQSLPPRQEAVIVPDRFPELEEDNSQASVSLDTKPLISSMFLQTQALAQPLPSEPPVEIPQLDEPAALPQIAMSSRQPHLDMIHGSMELAKPLPSSQRVLRAELPEPEEPGTLPQLAMNSFQSDSGLLIAPVTLAEPRLSDSAIPRVLVPEVREPDPLPVIDTNTQSAVSALYGSSLNVAKPAPSARFALVQESATVEVGSAPSPAQSPPVSLPRSLSIERSQLDGKQVTVAQLEAPPPVLKARPIATQVTSVPVMPASPKPVAAEPKSAARVTQQTSIQTMGPAKAIPAPSGAGEAFPVTQPAAGQVISQPSAPVAPRYSGELISLELKDADLKDFFRLVGEISGLNIVLDPDVKGSLTIFLNDVPWDQALDVVMKNNSLGKQLEGNVLRIATNSTLEAEETQRKRLADARVLSAELQTETRVLSYAKAQDLSVVLKKILSPRGEIIVDPRTNSMVISDIPGKFPAIDALIKQLDKKIRQVEIEARVIAANRDFLRDVGIQWGAIMGNNSQNKIAGALPGNPFSRTPAPSVSVPPTSGSGGSPNAVPLNVNLAASAATSSLSAFIGFSSNFILDTIITAAERHGNARLLSKPKILTQDNIEGFVQQGVKIPVQTTINNTISVQFFDFALKLRVTPQITEEGTIMLNVNIENSTPDFSRVVQGVPTVNTQETRTTILVNNGGTVVVGGVLIDNEQINIRQVPGFGNIPLIGNLFKERSVTKTTQELVFFLSPKIL
jgi:type IV pilus secretin PilQ/predicted competence protein